MNRKFKVGDIVVLSREGDYLGALGTILAEEKHLFEVESRRGSDRVNLKSTSTNMKFAIYVETIRHATLKERYLRDGNSIVFDGVSYLVSGNKVVSLRNGLYTNYFDSNLLAVTDRKPITKVFNNLSKKFVDIIDENHKLTTVLWERKPEIQLTSDEVVILKSIDEGYRYIARDNDGTLSLFEKEPTKSSLFQAYVSDVTLNWQHLSPFNHLFQDITFESGAHLIADLIKEKKQWVKINI